MRPATTYVWFLLAAGGVVASLNPLKVGSCYAASDAATYVGNEQCAACHSQPASTFAETAMGKTLVKHPRTEEERLGCESCHGPGSRHVEAVQSGEPVAGTLVTFRPNAGESASDQNAACLQCHERGEEAYWRGSPHESTGLACISCHSIMARRPEPGQLITADSRTTLARQRAATQVCLNCHPTQRAQLQRSSHMPVREGKLTCVSCHNPHGSASEALLKDNSVNENCYRCHADKRGPFLWEHPPARENCLTCHEPHGSVHEALLTARAPRLCQQCHMESTHAANPLDAGSRFVFNKSCANCHPQVHGSNHPSGVRLQR